MQLYYLQRIVKACFIWKYNFGVYSMVQQCFLLKKKKKEEDNFSCCRSMCFSLPGFADVISSFSHLTDIWRTLSAYGFDLVTNISDVSAEHSNKINCLQENSRQKVLPCKGQTYFRISVLKKREGEREKKKLWCSKN